MFTGFSIKFAEAVAMGLYGDQAFVVHKFGRNDDVDVTSGVPETVWQNGGLYNWPADTRQTFYLSSANDGDTAVIRAEGLDGNKYLKSTDYTLTGQTPLAMTDWTRLHRAYNAGDAGEEFTGPVYMSLTNDHTAGVPNVSTNIVGYLSNEAQQTRLGLYSVPADHIGILLDYLITVGDVSSAAANREAFVQLMIRDEGKIFRERLLFSVRAGGGAKESFGCPIYLAPKKDLEFRVLEISDNNTEISVDFTMILVKKALWLELFSASGGVAKSVGHPFIR